MSLIFLSFSLFAESDSPPLADLKETLRWSFEGSYKQFQEPPSWVMGGTLAPLLIYSFKEDKRLTHSYVRNHERHGYEKVISDLGVAVNFQIIPLTTYMISRYKNDEKLKRFSQETLGAGVLSMVETNLISIIPVHPRPHPENANFFEKAFRFESSFPSGHVLGYYVTAYKTFQFYGPYYAAIPAAAAIVTSLERVKSDKHYFSDVIGGVLISLLACEGVRSASNYDGNDPHYNWITRHDVKVGFSKKEENWMGQISLTY